MNKYMDFLARGAGYASYNIYLQSEHWQAFIQRARKSKCFCCGKGAKLQVHHLTYERLGKERIEDVVTVCNGCHKGIHKLVKAGTSLENAHFIFLKRGKFPKTRKPKKRKWVNWRKLCNPAFKEKPRDVVEFLRSAGLMLPGTFAPSTKAYARGFARSTCKPDGSWRVHWNLTTYINERRKLRKRR